MIPTTLELLELGVRVVHYQREQPGSVSEVAARLFPAYQVEGGRVYLAGCRWVDRPFFCFRKQQNGQVEEIWINDHSEPVSPEQLQQLALREARPIPRPPQYALSPMDQAVSLLQEQAKAFFSHNGHETHLEIATVWCRFIEGKLRFSIGSATADLSFSGWMQTLQAPPYICPYTGRPTYHLAATDDGRILDASAVGRCEVSGRRVPVDDLVRCSWTGKRVAKELIDFCSLSGQAVLRTELCSCSICHQKVSPAALQHGICSACRGLQTVSKADPRMARLLAEYPTLDRWHHWQLAETQSVYVLRASGLWKKLLLVVDKETLELRHLATGNRLQTRWRTVEPGQYSFVLRE
ncbi:MAG: hypothetical protein NZ602_11535 [Thermoguttaceae bacterium]|nr:hypothetical protein [Thermoguttaceae bacterium]MDW8039528.1 hypothetical protein [Thermoguttaceae bacterium]